MSRLNPQLLRSAGVAALGSFLFGFDTAVISGATEALRLRLRPEQPGARPHRGQRAPRHDPGLASAWAGPPRPTGGGPCLQRAGRALLRVGPGLRPGVELVGALVLFRFVGGLAIGGSSVVAPMYIAEISPAAVRGRLVALSQLNVVAGILVAYLSNFVIAGVRRRARVDGLALHARPSGAARGALLRPPRGHPGEPALAHQAAPRRRGRRGAARAWAAKTRRRSPPRSPSRCTRRPWSADEPFFQRKYRRPILLALMVATFNQLSGINALIYYTADIFAHGGGGPHRARSCSP